VLSSVYTVDYDRIDTERRLWLHAPTRLPGVKCGAATNKAENVVPRIWPSPPCPTNCPSTPELRLLFETRVAELQTSKVNMPTTLKEFESVWPRIVADLQDHCKGYKLPQQSLDWFTKVPPRTMLSTSHMLTTTPVS
jgi:hypothetical protein